MEKTAAYLKLLNKKIDEITLVKEPKELYEPMAYALTMGGKRLRPVMTLMACEMFRGNVPQALPAALALEVFHNFTLVHDDIMDVAPLRRGKQTVYKKWNTNIGILSGDAMFAKAFEIIAGSGEKTLNPLVRLLSKVAIEVCEGQQYDMNFEHCTDVSIADYLMMIRLKTAVLIASSLKAGAIVAGATEQDTNDIYLFGENLGMAFQLKDDILDIFSDEKVFGKKKGGDIVAGKKTYMFLKAFEMANEDTRKTLINHFTNTAIERDTKVRVVTAIYEKLGVKKCAEALIDEYSEKALNHLKSIRVPEEDKKNLEQLSKELLLRNF